MGWIKRFLDTGRRNTDLGVLWPECVRQASDTNHAKAAFMWHVMNDPAWTDYYNEDELREFIDGLKA